MERLKLIFVFLSIISYCSCELSYEKKNKLVNGFIDFYNRLPNQIYTCAEGYIQNAQQSTEQNSFEITVTLKVSEKHYLDSTRYLRCTAKVVDLEDDGVSVLNHHCEEPASDDKVGDLEEIIVPDITETSSDIAETPIVRKPVQLDNEVQTNTAVTSGEQFIAVPREESKVNCIGCSSHVNPQAPGVSELASIGVQQLNSLEPNVKHTLSSVLDVERQVQVVNGIRYVLTLIIDYNSCQTSETEKDTCLNSKTCKITFLEKPWIKLQDGSKYRAILANNCTEQWQFGDDGVVIGQTLTDNRENNNINPPQTDGGPDIIIKPVHNIDVQAQQNIEKSLTDDDIKVIEDQIIPHKQFEEHESGSTLTATSNPTETSESGKEHAVKVESASLFSPNSISATKPVKIESLSDDHKKAIDDMLSFFNFAGFDSARPDEEKTRLKRSYNKDLNILNLVKKFQKVKKNVENAKYVYKLAQIVVDYLNEIDLQVKTRVLKDVINAEEEFENYQHFYYIQSRVIIPCDKSECEEKDTVAKICNAVLDGTKSVQILNVFCHDEPKAKPLGKVDSVDFDDPVLLELIKEATNKIESESTYGKAMKVNKILDANTQRISGTMTKFSIVLDHTNCNITVPLVLRSNCSIVEELGSQVCDVSILVRHWLKERKITYTCTERPVDTSFSNIRKLGVKTSVNDPAVLDMVNEALQYLDVQSNRNNKQIVVKINSVATQLVAGFLTDVEFVVGYTTCTNDNKQDTSKCKLLIDEPLRTCKAKVWDRTWIEDGRKVDVSCKEPNTEDNEHPKRIKRGLLLGGRLNQDLSSPEFKKLAKEALKKYLKNSVYQRHYDLLDIQRATVTVVAGTLTELEFKISPTNCLIDHEGNPSSSDCQILNYNDVTTCNSRIWEKGWLNFKEINVTCHDDSENTRIKRQIINAVVEQDPNDLMYKTLAEESKRKYLHSSGNTKKYKVVKINRVTTQVLSGIMTKINFKIGPVDQTTGDVLSCESEIMKQPLKSKKIYVQCHKDESRSKREATHKSYTGRKLLNFVGEQKHQNVDNPKFKTLAKESLQKFILSSGGSQHYRLISIEKATVKKKSGVMTSLEFSISPTNCQVDTKGHPSSSDCKVIDPGDVISCSSKIIEQESRNSKDIDVTCHVHDLFNRVKRQIVDHTPQKNYSIESQSRDIREIFSDILSLKSSTNINLGGLQEKNPTKIEYRKLAQYSLNSYLKRQKNLTLHNVVKVKKVAMKIVSGIMYYIEYVAAPTSCAIDISTCVDKESVLHCVAEVWDKPRSGKKEVMRMSCRANNKKKRTHSLKLKSDEETINEEERRVKRQTDTEEDYVDEDMSFYYADRAVKQLNDQLKSNNLHKLITIHGAQNSVHMNQPMVRMYIETAETYCLRHRDEGKLSECEELDGIPHQLCLARLWPSPDDALVVQQITLVCDDEELFESVTGLSLPTLLRASIKEIEKSPTSKYKLVHQGEPQMIPTLDSNFPITLNFIVASTNCSKNLKIDLNKPNIFNCFIDISRPSKACRSHIWMSPNSKNIRKITAQCGKTGSRQKRSVSLNPSNSTADELIIQSFVQDSLHKLEMASSHRYKQRVLQINSYSTKITSGKVTTIDFDVGYTSCLKFEWVDDVKTCEFLEHLPRRHCVSQVWERLWLDNGRNIEVTCEEDETPLEAHIEFESAETAMKLANEALKHIEAKYPHPRKQKVVRIFSLEKQVVAGIHYRMKLEVGSTQCPALSAETNCTLEKDTNNNKFCRVNVWLRPWADRPPSFRVTCDYQEGAAAELYHHLQAEQLFRDFLTTYKPEYINKANEIKRRFEIFKTNIRKIHELNTHEKGTATYGVTRFTDLSYDEFAQKFLGLKPSLRDTNQVPMRKAEIPDLRIPEKFDWRDYDAVTEVKDQGSCGSCWAFSVTGNIEGQWKMQSGTLVSLSEQELVDCDAMDQGCNGGLPDNAYRAIEQLGGLELEKDYPYEGEDDKCSFNKTMSKVQITGAVNITSNETDMAKWLVQNGPISIGINANAMQFYMGGVSHPWKMLCNPGNLDHGVLIVGYGVKDYPLFHKRLPFWTIKNSWGAGWGEQGYYRVFRGDGTCGVNQMASSAVI